MLKNAKEQRSSLLNFKSYWSTARVTVIGRTVTDLAFLYISRRREKITLKYCIKYEQERIIRFTNSRRSRQFFHLIIHYRYKWRHSLNINFFLYELLMSVKNIVPKNRVNRNRTSPEFKMLLMSSRNSSTTICKNWKDKGKDKKGNKLNSLQVSGQKIMR